MSTIYKGTTPVILEPGMAMSLTADAFASGSIAIDSTDVRSIATSGSYSVGPYSTRREIVVQLNGGSANLSVGSAGAQPIPTAPSVAALTAGAPGLWWDFQTTFGKTALADRASHLILSNTIGTPLTLSSTQPFVPFNGTGALQSNILVMTALQKAIFDLSTISTSDMFVMWAILTHGTTAGSATNTLFFWGRNNNGWGLQFFGGASTCKVKLYHTPQGGSNETTGTPGGFQLVGDNANNTKTAFAMTITRSPSVGDIGNDGKGGGHFHVEMAMNGLVQEGPFGQTNSCVSFPARIPSGTAPASYTDTGLTIGGRPTTNATTITEPMLSNWGLDQIGFQRRRRQHGFAQVLVRQLAAQYRVAPTIMVQPTAAAS